jgi:hypothetical protein
MWRGSALGTVILLGGLAAANGAAGPHCAAATTLSKLDYLVLASMADSQLLSMAAFRSTTVRAARRDGKPFEVPPSTLYMRED